MLALSSQVSPAGNPRESSQREALAGHHDWKMSMEVVLVGCTQRCRIETTMTDGRANGIVNVAYEIAKRNPWGGITQIQQFSSHLSKASESMGAGAHISMNTNHLNYFCARISQMSGR